MTDRSICFQATVNALSPAFGLIVIQTTGIQHNVASNGAHVLDGMGSNK